jgi:hypothetical protein
MTDETNLDALRPEFAGLVDYMPPYLAADVQAYMDCMGALVAAKELGHPMPLIATYAAFGRLKLFGMTINDICNNARGLVKSGEAQAQAIMRQGGIDANMGEKGEAYAASMTAEYWKHNTTKAALQLRDAKLAEDEAAPAPEG